MKIKWRHNIVLSKVIAVATDYNNGMSIKDIESKYAISRWTIGRYLRLAEKVVVSKESK